MGIKIENSPSGLGGRQERRGEHKLKETLPYLLVSLNASMEELLEPCNGLQELLRAGLDLQWSEEARVLVFRARGG